MNTQHLHSQFRSDFARANLGAPDTLFDELTALYNEPTRHYHNLTHLAHCLDELAACPPSDINVAPALWFHDAIYEPTRHDNEQQSANLAAARLAALNAPQECVAAVTRLILATTHKSPSTTPDEQLITDIDLAILGQPPQTFDAYEHNIRNEHAHVPDPQFRTGRAAVLQHFLARPAIYHTPHFHNKYETQARANLTRSLRKLDGPAH